MRKKFGFVILPILIFIGIFFIYYVNIEDNYEMLQEFKGFPIPNEAILEGESSISKNYIWNSSSGTSIPFGYRLMIKKKGWKQVEVDGHGITYEKNGYRINITVASGYMDVIKVN